MNFEYKILDRLGEGRSTIINRVQISSGERLVLKTLKPEATSREATLKLKHEYDVLQKLDSPFVIKALEFDAKGKSLVLEDFKGVSLSEAFNKKLSIKELLAIAILLAQGLASIHHQKVIHKDIKPPNILIDFATYKIKYIDFEIATFLSREIQSAINLSTLEGTLAYISPEQTGRMNRSIDYRTDIYSLGVTLYQFFTKKLPFESSSQLELVHMHIARPPIPPHMVDASLPSALSEIIMKCLAKNADERYQSALGLEKDLQICHRQLEETKEIKPFKIGQEDIIDRFYIPDNLYGRDHELEKLFSCFEKIKKGKQQVLLVKGHPGIGKTRLINEIQRPIIKERGFLAAGKFEQFKKQAPYLGLSIVLESLIQQLFAETEEQLALWKDKILKAVGQNGQVLIEMLPNIAKIIGKQPPLPLMDPHATEIRFYRVFTSLIEVFLEGTRPLVIFLDDLQWADEQSIKFFESFLSDLNHGNLLFIGAYRDTEVTLSHPLALMLKRLDKAAIDISSIELLPLSQEPIEELLEDTLHCGSKALSSLASLVLQKTQGNPFFVRQFLNFLFAQSLFTFDPIKRCWDFKLADIKRLQTTENVAELMSEKIRLFSPPLKTLLKIGAAVGNNFNLTMVADLANLPFEEALHELQVALREELIFKEQDEYIYIFIHDRIQKACYQLIQNNEKADLHYRIGKKILSETPEDKILENINEITDHLNEALSLIHSKEKNKIAHLNYLAGKKAMDSAAFEIALKYFKTAIFLLGSEAWETSFQLTTDTYKGIAACQMILNNTEEAEEVFELLLRHAQTPAEKGLIYKDKNILLAQEGKYEEALETGVKAAALFGIRIPLHPSKLRIGYEKYKTQLYMSLQDPLKAKKMENSRVEIGLTICRSMLHIAHVVNPPSFLCNIHIGMQIACRYGVNEDALIYYLAMSIILCHPVEGRYQEGIKLSQGTLQLSKSFPKSPIIVEMSVPYYMGLHQWVQSFINCSDELKSMSRQILEVSHIPNALFCLAYAIFYSIQAGEGLKSIMDDLSFATDLANKYQVIDMALFIKIEADFCLSLRGPSINTSFIKPFTDQEKELLSQTTISSFPHFIYEGWHLYHNYLFGKYEEAIQLGHKFIEISESFIGSPIWNLIYVYYPLSLCAHCLKKKNKQEWREILRCQKILKDWAEASPNYPPHYSLLSAEIAQIEGKKEIALSLYQKAIKQAKERGFQQLDALINERLIYFYLNQNDKKKAQECFRDAVKWYAAWGATKKVQELKQAHYALSEEKAIEEMTTSSNVSITTYSTTESLDIGTFVEVSQILSKEIVLDKLIDKILHLIIVNAGADKAFLLLSKNGKLVTQAKMSLNETQATLLDDVAAEAIPDEFCVSAVNYVARTCESLVANNASEEGLLLSDPYVIAHHPQSIAAIPIIEQKNLVGVLYLENRLSKGAFVKERIQLLMVLSSQMAISLENARHLEHIEKMYKAAERFVPKEFLELLGKKRFEEVMLGDSAKRNITAMFTDIREFTTLAESLSPEQTTSFLNTYTRHMAPIIRKHNGFINLFLGDGILALFPESAEDAVQAAVEIILALAGFNAESEQMGFRPVKVGIGINSGEVMICTLGEEERMDASIVSDAINVASRIENLNKVYKTQLLISDVVYQSLTHRKNYLIRMVDKVILKGKTLGTRIYEVQPLPLEEMLQNKERLYIELFSKAFTAYETGDFANGEIAFRSCLQEKPHDAAAELLLERCLKYQREGSPSDWDGTFKLLEK